MTKLMRRTRIPGWYEFYRTACPICGKVGGCITNEDGGMVACIRVESPHPFSKNSALPSFLHFMKEGKRHRVDTRNVEPFEQSLPKAEVGTLHAVYSALLDCLSLTDEHYAHLTSPSRGLSDEVVRIRQYKSLPARTTQVVRDMSEWLGMDDFSGVPGFYEQKTVSGSAFWAIAGMEGILIPYRDQRNRIIGFQYRIDNPPNDVVVDSVSSFFKQEAIQVKLTQPNRVLVAYEGEVLFDDVVKEGVSQPIVKGFKTVCYVRLKKGNRYFWLSSANKPKGTGVGNPAPVHVAVPSDELATWQRGTLRKAHTVWVSEGALKCDIAADLVKKLYSPEEWSDVGTTFLALPGVNAYRLVFPILQEMGVRQVNLAFDMDAARNPHVQKAMIEFVKELKTQRYQVRLALWNEEHKGIDDLFLHSRLPQFHTLNPNK
jgi:hypothetical protein